MVGSRDGVEGPHDVSCVVKMTSSPGDSSSRFIRYDRRSTGMDEVSLRVFMCRRWTVVER